MGLKRHLDKKLCGEDGGTMSLVKGKEVITKCSALGVAFKEQRYENIWGSWYPLASVSGKMDTIKLEIQDQKQNSKMSVIT